MLGAAGCSDDADTADPAPRCEDALDDGARTEDAVEASKSGCLHEEGQLVTYDTASVECDDDRTLFANEAGWGYSDDVWHARELNSLPPPPASELLACTG